MTQSGNNNYNALIAKTKLNDRKDPQSSLKEQYSYMIAVEDRLRRFLQRMSDNKAEDDQGNLNGLIK